MKRFWLFAVALSLSMAGIESSSAANLEGVIKLDTLIDGSNTAEIVLEPVHYPRVSRDDAGAIVVSKTKFYQKDGKDLVYSRSIEEDLPASAVSRVRVAAGEQIEVEVTDDQDLESGWCIGRTIAGRRIQTGPKGPVPQNADSYQSKAFDARYPLSALLVADHRASDLQNGMTIRQLFDAGTRAVGEKLVLGPNLDDRDYYFAINEPFYDGFRLDDNTGSLHVTITTIDKDIESEVTRRQRHPTKDSDAGVDDVQLRGIQK